MSGAGLRSKLTGMSRIWNVAHRGASADRPENTLAAFELAIAQGCDVIEVDVRASADMELFAMHDPTVDRTTDGSGPLSALTAAEVRALDAGGEKVPSIGEVLALAKGRVRVNLDLKELDTAEPAVRLVREVGMESAVTYISFLPEAWDVLDRIAPDSPVVQLVDSASTLAGIAMGELAHAGVRSGVGMPHGLVSTEIVERLHRHGMGVFAWTVDDESEMRRLISSGVNGIVTNRPGALAEVIRQGEEATAPR